MGGGQSWSPRTEASYGLESDEYLARRMQLERQHAEKLARLANLVRLHIVFPRFFS
jgi:hypothetical protein